MSRRKRTKVVHPTFPATPPRSMEPRKLREYQVEAADAVTNAHAAGVEGPAVVLPTGSGKSHTDSTLVPTPNGVRKHGDLRVGDFVFHPSGKAVRVTGVYPQGVLPTWMIRFSDNTSVLCSGDHLWQVTQRRRKPQVMTTEQIAATKLIDEKDNGAYRWRIPMTAPVEYLEAVLPVEPYVLGAIIANGHIPRRGGAAHLHLTTPDTEVHTRVSQHYRTRLQEFDEGCPYLSFPGEHGLMQSLTDLRLRVRSSRKFIPEQYLTASVDQRVALLQGLMDGDGSSRAGGRRSVNYHTTAIRLARGVQRLVWSLGGTATRHTSFRSVPATGRPYAEYTLSILLPSSIEPFHSSRKKRSEKPRHTFEPHRSIVAIERAGHAECTCISVDAEDGLYLVGEEHIVTHNTTVIAELVRREVINGRRVLLMAHRNELIEQMADAVVAVNPTGPLSAKIGGPHRGDPNAQIISATVQSLQKDRALARIGMRDLVIVDECFPAGTLVDDRPIETLAAGDLITAVSSDGSITRRAITSTMHSVPSGLVRVHLSCGQSIACTPGHPFLTTGGWVPAAHLSRGALLHHARWSEVGEDTEIAEGPATLHSVRSQLGHVHEEPARHLVGHKTGVLLPAMCEEVRPQCLVENDGTHEPEARLLMHAEEQPDVAPGECGKDASYAAGDRASSADPRRKRDGNHRTTEEAVRGAGVADRGCDRGRGRRTALLVQRGHRERGDANRRGSRRWFARRSRATSAGLPQGHSTVGYRVDRVEVLEPGRDGTYGGVCPGGVVYNLEVEVDHTYTVGSGVVVHNCHHAPARTYRKVLDHFALLGGRRAGFTATMVRHAPTKGEPPLRTIWSEVVYERDIVWAIENGFLLPPEGVTVELPDLDVTALHQGAGDITDDEAESAMMRDTTLNATVEAVLDRTGDLSTIVFGASMAHCRQLAESLVELGVTAEVVVGPTTVHERTGIYNRFRSGETRVLVTVDVLTEGADFPRCEVVVLARPTRSQSRLIQQVGRALRPHTYEDGRVKVRALVVDLVGAGSLGLIAQTRLDPEHREESESDDEIGLGCMCPQPCAGEQCDYSCIGVGCACGCSCAETPTGGSDIEPESTVPCTCTCTLTFGLCRCGCECDLHRVDPLQTFDPIMGTLVKAGKQLRSDSSWSTRTATVRWVRHPRGLVRSVYRQTGSKGVLMLADMRGVAGVVPGKDWAFGFFDTSVRRMFWVATDGQWTEPGPECFLRGMSLDEADALAQQIFAGHMRDANRELASEAQIAMARGLGVPDAEQLDRRDLSDMIAMAQADYWIPNFPKPSTPAETAA